MQVSIHLWFLKFRLKFYNYLSISLKIILPHQSSVGSLAFYCKTTYNEKVKFLSSFIESRSLLKQTCHVHLQSLTSQHGTFHAKLLEFSDNVPSHGEEDGKKALVKNIEQLNNE